MDLTPAQQQTIALRLSGAADWGDKWGRTSYPIITLEVNGQYYGGQCSTEADALTMRPGKLIPGLHTVPGSDRQFYLIDQR